MAIQRLFLRLSLATVVLVLLGVGSDAHAKTYNIEVLTEPSGAKVYLNNKRGKLLGKTPFRGKLRAGDHTLYITKNGYEPVYQVIEVKKRKGGRQDFSSELQRVEFGTVKVVATPDVNAKKIKKAKIYIDGKFEGYLPDTFKQISTGPHQVEVKKPAQLSKELIGS